MLVLKYEQLSFFLEGIVRKKKKKRTYVNLISCLKFKDQYKLFNRRLPVANGVIVLKWHIDLW